MQGKKINAPRLFYQVSLESLVPQDHVIRKIDKILDLGFLYAATKPYYAHDGKPSVDPIVLFKLYLLGYFFGIPSERRILQEVQVNLAYRWYLGYDFDEQLPDHSVLTKARYRFPEAIFERFFKHIVLLCRRAGLIDGKYHFIDSTAVKADAAKESVTYHRHSWWLEEAPLKGAIKTSSRLDSVFPAPDSQDSLDF